MARSCDHEWRPPVATAAAPAAGVAKPKGGARLLSFLIQGAVMAVALALFFLFAGVAALILLHLFVAGRAFRRRRRSRVTATRGAAAAADGGVDDGPLRGLSPADLRRLPWFEYSPSPWPPPPPPPDCVVCLEGIRARERCRALPPCGHVFHAACVDRWLVKSPACPICRAAVWAAGEEIARAPRRWV